MTTDNVDVLSGGNTPQGANAKGESEAEILANLVGEGKPFKTVEALAKSKKEADSFIEQLKAENADMRKALGKVETSEKTNEILQTLMARLDKASDGSGDGNQSGETLTREDIVKLVQNQVTEETKARARAANREKANADLLKLHANDAAKASAYVTLRATELGLNREALVSMAETMPSVFQALVLGTGNNRGSAELTLSASRGGSPPPKTPGSGGDDTPRNYAYYKELRGKLGHRFYEPKIQQQMIRDRKTLGENFFDKQ